MIPMMVFTPVRLWEATCGRLKVLGDYAGFRLDSRKKSGEGSEDGDMVNMSNAKCTRTALSTHRCSMIFMKMSCIYLEMQSTRTCNLPNPSTTPWWVSS